MQLSLHAQRVDAYYTQSTPGFYIGPRGWDPEHLHFGIFSERSDEEYRRDPSLIALDRRAAIDRMTAKILEPAGLGPSRLVIDAGCGVGGTVNYIARTYGSRVVGLNINELQLEIARGRSAEAGLDDRASYRLADCTQRLPFEDGSVDAVVNIEAACHMCGRSRFIHECARVLAPGGYIVAGDWMVADGLSDEDRARTIEPLEDAWFLHQMDSLASYRALLERAGFDVREAETIELGIRPNGYLMEAGCEQLLASRGLDHLSEQEQGNLARARTFADALLGGHLKIGRYVAVRR